MVVTMMKMLVKNNLVKIVGKEREEEGRSEEDLTRTNKKDWCQRQQRQKDTTKNIKRQVKGR